MFEYSHFINNEFIEGSPSATYEVFNPATDESVGKINCARETEVDAAVAAAHAAFEPWSATPAAKRAALINKFADLMKTNTDELAQEEMEAMGQPVAIAGGGIVPLAVKYFRYYAGWADKIEGQTFPAEEDRLYSIQYEPIGKVGPALAAGNTVVYKTSEKSPFSMLVIARLVKEAGFPPGVFNIVSGDGATGALLASHMDVDKISFTGSGSIGRKVLEAAAKSNLKKVTLELGGKSPSLVFEDADIENALTESSQGFLLNSSQMCIAASRLFVQNSIANEFIQALKGRFLNFNNAVGDPSAPQTYLGPLADKNQLQRVLGYIESGKKEAKLLVGGELKGDKGTFVEPTIFLNPGKDAKILREEIFGPVLTVLTFEPEEEAIKLANDTSFGLSASVYTGSIGRAQHVASKIKAGTVGINMPFLPCVNAATGGYKQSGHGKESGKEGLMAYLQAKSIGINLKV